MALKGHTRIELTNVETGEVEVYEDDNMVTNALSKLLGSYGWFGIDNINTIMSRYEDSASVIKRLTGGIMLFDSNIEENADIINSPLGVSIVGCGSLSPNISGDNLMAGSYNTAESGFTDEGGYKHVWDFSTSQANGTIACASLTTNAGGKITDGTYPFSSNYFYGEGENIDDEILFNNFKNIEFVKHEHFDYFANWLLFADGINNRIIFPKTQEEVIGGEYEIYDLPDGLSENSIFRKFSIDLNLYRFGFSNFSIFDSINNSTTMQLLDTVTVNMPDYLKNVIEELHNVATYYPPNHFYACSMYDENNIYIVMKLTETMSSSVEFVMTDEKIYIWQINATTFESDYFEITNILSENILKPTHSNFSICGDYILCVGEESKQLYVVNKNNNDFQKIQTPTQQSYSYDNDGIIYNNGQKFFMVSKGMIYVIDPVTKEMRIKNIYMQDYFPTFNEDYSIVNCLRVMKVKGKHYSIFITSYDDEEEIEKKIFNLYLCIDPTLLVTINNLETPVQKTSAQTMKVTYVLTQE